jgi:hypothetical protein
VRHLLQCLRQGGVGVDVAGDLGGCQVPLLGEGQLGQQLGDIGSDHVCAEDFTLLRVGDQLHESGRVPKTMGFAIRAERELRDLYLIPFVTRLLLGVAERANLRLAVGRRGTMS